MKRATDNIVTAAVHMDISIHALVKRATCDALSDEKSREISIHALVKRATIATAAIATAAIDFNPRPREEGDKRYA